MICAYCAKALGWEFNDRNAGFVVWDGICDSCLDLDTVYSESKYDKPMVTDESE
jgi:hypothetical protein